MKPIAVAKRGLFFGLVTGVLVSVVVTVIVTVWEWLENPGGIFRGPGGTNWKFIVDTAISWLLPTFAYVMAIAFVGHVLWSLISQLYEKSKGNLK